MSKVIIFPGQPIFGQLIALIPRQYISELAEKHASDHYYKGFMTYDHVVTMVYAAMSGGTSIRGVVLGLLAAGNRIDHLGIDHFPRRSTISDANKLRPSAVFGDLYQALYRHYRPVLSDSGVSGSVLERLIIIDSTTISLFKEILKAAGRNPANGKRKGGIKSHISIESGMDVPKMVCYSASAKNDGPFVKKASLVQGDIAVFDMGYCNYSLFLRWTQLGIFFVTRQKEGALYEVIQDIPISKLSDARVILDQQIKVTDLKSGETVILRRIVRSGDEDSQELVFWTNIFHMNAELIAKIYKRRWQIELLFKRLKHNFQLKYFLGDNVNAIEIQIWCCLIAHLLYKVVLKGTKRNWAFSNFADLIRQHLFTYIDLPTFLNDPEQALRDRNSGKASQSTQQLKLF